MIQNPEYLHTQTPTSLCRLHLLYYRHKYEKFITKFISQKNFICDIFHLNI